MWPEWKKEQNYLYRESDKKLICFKESHFNKRRTQYEEK